MTPMMYEVIVNAEDQEYAREIRFAEPWRCPEKGHRNLKSGEIAGITVGSIVFVAIVVAVIIIVLKCTKCCKRKTSKTNAQLNPVK